MKIAMEQGRRCPHCGAKLLPFRPHEEGGWGEAPHFACFNDECPYFRDGWEWMQEKYRVRASYRYRLTNLQADQDSPLAVWSETAFLDRIIEDG